MSDDLLFYTRLKKREHSSKRFIRVLKTKILEVLISPSVLSWVKEKNEEDKIFVIFCVLFACNTNESILIVQLMALLDVDEKTVREVVNNLDRKSKEEAIDIYNEVLTFLRMIQHPMYYPLTCVRFDFFNEEILDEDYQIFLSRIKAYVFEVLNEKDYSTHSELIPHQFSSSLPKEV